MGLDYLESFEHFSHVQKTIEKKGLTLVHKGATPIVFSPAQTPTVYHMPCNLLAKAGMGDALAGSIAAASIHLPHIKDAFDYSHCLVQDSMKKLTKDWSYKDRVLPSDIIEHFAK